MEEIIQSELREVETQIIRFEAQLFEIREQLTISLGKRSSLLSLSEKVQNQAVTE